MCSVVSDDAEEEEKTFGGLSQLRRKKTRQFHKAVLLTFHRDVYYDKIFT